MVNEEIINILQGDIELYRRKQPDYSPNHPLENFRKSAEFVNYITGSSFDDVHSCLVLIGTKIARLSSLLSSGAEPKNESILDTLRDTRVYLAALELALTERERKKTATKCTSLKSITKKSGNTAKPQKRKNPLKKKPKS